MLCDEPHQGCCILHAEFRKQTFPVRINGGGADKKLESIVVT